MNNDIITIEREIIKMANYSVCIMVPFSVDVEADSFKEAIEKAFQCKETAMYGGDGIFVRNTDTDETYEE